VKSERRVRRRTKKKKKKKAGPAGYLVGGESVRSWQRSARSSELLNK
jgi:hypothetical protein